MTRAPLSSAVVGPDEARVRARRILAGRRYSERQGTSNPLGGPFRWIGRQLSKVGRWIGDLFNFAVPGGSGVAWIVFGALAIIAIALLVRALGRRRRSPLRHLDDVDTPIDIDALDRDAIAAEARGDHRLAVELRFRAGVGRLDRDTLVRARTATNSAIATELPDSFPGLGTTFDAVHYGNAGATADDAEAAKDGWAHTLALARARGLAAPRSGWRSRRAAPPSAPSAATTTTPSATSNDGSGRVR